MEQKKDFDDRYVAYTKDGKHRSVKATTGAIIEKDNKILLTKRNIELFKGDWCLPGGHIEYFEHAKDAIIREVKEETGLDFDGNFTGYIDEIIPEISWHAELLIFRGIAAGKEKKEDVEVQEMRWFSKEDALKQKLAFKHLDAIKRYA